MIGQSENVQASEVNMAAGRNNSSRILRGVGRAGFTIIEVMIVLVIIGIIGGIVTYNLVGQTDRARISATEQTMATLQGGLTELRAKYGSYPEGSGAFPQEIFQIVTDISDAWGNPIMYYAPDPYRDYAGGAYVLISAGPDGNLDTLEDNIFLRPKQQP